MIGRQTLDYWASQLDDIWREQMQMIHPGKNLDEAIRESFGHLIADPTRLENADIPDFKRLVNGWLSTKRFTNNHTNGKQPNRNQQHIQSLADHVARTYGDDAPIK